MLLRLSYSIFILVVREGGGCVVYSDMVVGTGECHGEGGGEVV